MTRINVRKALVSAVLMASGFVVLKTTVFHSTLPAAWAGTVAVSGVVTDRSSHAAISGAYVTVSETLDFNANGVLDVFVATTNASGQFSVTVPDTTPWLDVRIAAEAYAPFRHLSALAPLQNVLAVACEMDADQSFHVVTVGVTAGGNAVASAHVYESAEHSSVLGITDSTGSAHVALGSGRYMLTVGAENRATVTNLVDLSTMSSPYSVSFSLSGQTRGLLTGTFGAPSGTTWTYTRAGLSFLPVAGEAQVPLRAAVTSGGGYSVYGIGDGSYMAVLEADGRVFAQAAAISSQTASPYNISFGEIATATKDLTVTLKDQAGHTVGGLSVGLGRLVQNVLFELNDTTLSSGGSATFTGLPSGTYWVFASLGGGRRPIVGSIELSSSTSIDVAIPATSIDVAFPEAGTDSDGVKTVAGTVVDATGSPISGAHVAISVARSRRILTTATTNSSGGYSLAGLAAGTYDVSAFAVVSGTTMLQVEGPTAVTVTSSASSATAPQIKLFAPHAVTFVVLETDSAGDAHPVAGATVTLTEAGTSPAVTHAGTSSSEGIITLAGVPLGEHDVTIEKSGYSTVTIKVPVSTSQEVLSGFSAQNVYVSISGN